MIEYRKHKLSRKEKILVAAGFFEGEGWARFHSSFSLQVKQNNPEPLLLVQSIFGGSIRRYEPSPNALSDNPYYEWALYGKPARAAAEAMYPFLSKYLRRKIDKAYRKWESR